jgi:hypothetical protein
LPVFRLIRCSLAQAWHWTASYSVSGTSSAGFALHHCRLCSACRARRRGGQARLQGSSPYARHACGFALAKQRPRYSRPPGIFRAQEHSAHRALYRAGAGSVQGLLALKRLLGRVIKRLHAPARFPMTIRECRDFVMNSGTASRRALALAISRLRASRRA